ncbi:MAG: OmpA family protein [Candidatus Krumholzibacteria bacterium]|nr:OmpA family protein [Candidatus Krumholzibacteria bacterium]
MRYLCTLLLVALLFVSITGSGAFAGNKEKKPDSRALCYIGRPWPFMKACACKDADGDGVPDKMDKCPDTPEGAKVDENGCSIDSDADGVADHDDKCPDTPKGAKVDEKGCPSDSDGDGVYDGIDQCRKTPKGAKVDKEGCPLDSDDDGVYDGLDKCPDTNARTKVDETGCPVKVSDAVYKFINTGLFSTTDIVFDVGKDDLKPESKEILDKIGEVLSEWPEAEVEIGGHTDSSGSESFNQKLSEDRAKSVRAYLLKNFPKLDPEFLKSAGYGESQPIASNDTEEGKKENRRVEFKILNQDELKRPVRE